MLEKTDKELAQEITDGVNAIKVDLEKRIGRLERTSDVREIEQKKSLLNLAFFGKSEYFPNTPEGKSFSEYLRKGELLDRMEMKALQIGDATLGGYAAPGEYLDRIVEKLTEISRIRQLAWVQPTSATTLEMPKETGQLDAGWVAEIGERIETTGTTLGLEKIPVHEGYALVKVSRQLVEDARTNLDDFLANRFARRLMKLEGLAFISGNAVGKPEGILTNPDVGYIPSGDAALLTADGFVDLVYSLPADYRQNASLIMNRKTIQTARKLKETGTGAYIWERSFALGQPETILGYPVVEMPDMPDVGTNTYPAAFGDFKLGYCIADRVGFQVQVLREKYIEYGLLGYMGRLRVGGQVVNAEAIKKLKIAVS